MGTVVNARPGSQGRRLLMAIVIVWGLAAGVRAGEPVRQASGPSTPSAEDLAREVFQIVQKNCIECHGEARDGGLDLRTDAGLQKGGRSGPAVVAREPAASRLYKAVTHEGDLQMPEDAPKLPEPALQTIRLWIESGASWAAVPAAVPAANSGGSAQIASPDAVVANVRNSEAFKNALAVLDRDHDRLIAEIIQLTEIPAPPFKEAARAKAYLEMLRASGLTDVEQDEEGNVMGLRRGSGQGRNDAPLIAIAAHLDTVFPEGTDVTVKREDTRLSAPGIGDDTRSLAVLLAMIRAMNEAGIRTTSDILFIGNVGEEGQGDLRGVKYLFTKGKYKDRIKMFISVDGAGGGANITHGGVGSKRYRVIFKGPGGHSYGAFGLVSPAFAMSGAMQKFGTLKVPEKPKTTYSVGVVGGGTSVNSIPFETWMELDMRSESKTELQKLDESLVSIINDAVREENAARSTAQGPITAELKLIGDRPSGETPITSPIVETAAASIRAAGGRPTFSWSSTDSNIPISLGIPAITVDSGGRGGRAHALDEWISVDKVPSLRGIEIALVTLLALAR